MIKSEDWWRLIIFETFQSNSKSIISTSQYDEISTNLFQVFSGAEAYEAFPEAERVLSAVSKRGFKVGVVSNTDERLHQVLDELKLKKYLDFVVVSKEFGEEKPHVSIFQEIAKKYADGKEAIHVGDDVSRDYRGALNAGWKAYLLWRKSQTKANPNSNSFPADIPSSQVLADLSELLPRLEIHN